MGFESTVPFSIVNLCSLTMPLLRFVEVEVDKTLEDLERFLNFSPKSLRSLSIAYKSFYTHHETPVKTTSCRNIRNNFYLEFHSKKSMKNLEN